MKRMISVLLAVCMLVVMFYFVAFESAHAMHHCTGEDCPICHELQIARQIVKQMGNAILTVMVSVFFVAFIKTVRSNHLSPISGHTLVFDKVRIND